MINSELLQNLLLEDTKSTGNKEGDTQLFILAEKLSSSDEKTLDKARNAIRSILLVKLNQSQINTFLSFLHYSKLVDNQILDYLYREFKSLEKNTDQENVIKALLIMRFIIENNKKYFSLNYILKKQIFKMKFPWIWFDCLAFYKPETCIREITDFLSITPNEFKSLLIRIPFYEKLFGKDLLIKGLKSWYPNLNEADRKKLEKWTNKFSIKLGLSISAERLIEGIPFRQIQLT